MFLHLFSKCRWNTYHSVFSYCNIISESTIFMRKRDLFSFGCNTLQQELMCEEGIIFQNRKPESSVPKSLLRILPSEPETPRITPLRDLATSQDHAMETKPATYETGRHTEAISKSSRDSRCFFSPPYLRKDTHSCW